MPMKRGAGFTIIELLVVLTLLIVGAVLFFTERAQVDAIARDSGRKVAINAMYYNLEEVYYPAHEYYPQTIDSKTLRAMDPALFTDPTGVALGDAGADYQYQGLDCTADGQCKKYRLSSTMEREGEYVKTNRRNN